MKELYETIFDTIDSNNTNKLSDELAFKIRWFKELNDFAYDIKKQIKIICKKHTHIDIEFNESDIHRTSKYYTILKKAHQISMRMMTSKELDDQKDATARIIGNYITSTDFNNQLFADIFKDVDWYIRKTINKYPTIKNYSNYSKDKYRIQIGFENILYPDMKPKYLFISSLAIFDSVGVFLIDVYSDPTLSDNILK